MANREELAIIRGARAGDAGCQLALGKLYLFGGASLPRNVPSALHWLHRAALQERAQAWMLIGRHIAFDQAQQCWPTLQPWYQRAGEAGVEQALLVLEQWRRQQALEQLGQQQVEQQGQQGQQQEAQKIPQQVQQQAPANAQRHAGDAASLLPPQGLAPAPVLYGASSPATPCPLPPQLSAQQPALLLTDVLPPSCEQQAYAGERTAQLALGLWYARMDWHGQRQEDGIATVNFKRAIRWLTLAGEQGLAEAWFALSRIYMLAEFSQRCVAEAQTYLERAAEMGHGAAQMEYGMYAWRNRRNDRHSDVRALYWLQKAALQGSTDALSALERISPAPQLSAWMNGIAPAALRALALRQPLLAARLALAGAFGLSRAEALLIDVAAADQGHCLVVDIRASYGRSKRRLIVLRTARERRVLNEVRRLFEQAGDSDSEGNYRQRLYRLKAWLPSAIEDELLAA